MRHEQNNETQTWLVILWNTPQVFIGQCWVELSHEASNSTVYANTHQRPLPTMKTVATTSESDITDQIRDLNTSGIPSYCPCVKLEVGSSVEEFAV